MKTAVCHSETPSNRVAACAMAQMNFVFGSQSGGAQRRRSIAGALSPLLRMAPTVERNILVRLVARPVSPLSSISCFAPVGRATALTTFLFISSGAKNPVRLSNAAELRGPKWILRFAQNDKSVGY